MPSNLVHEDRGRIRVKLHPITFQDLADTALDPLRQEARRNVAVAIRLLEGLTMLAACAARAAEREVLAGHGKLIVADALAATENDKDRSDLEARAAALREALSSPSDTA